MLQPCFFIGFRLNHGFLPDGYGTLLADVNLVYLQVDVCMRVVNIDSVLKLVLREQAKL